MSFVGIPNLLFNLNRLTSVKFAFAVFNVSLYVIIGFIPDLNSLGEILGP